MDIPIIVLAAGQSSRMGGVDKLMQSVDGEPLIARQAKLARSATKSTVIIALPVAPHPRHDVLRDLDVMRVEIPDAAEGMSASIRGAFAALPKSADAAMLILADLPDLTVEDIKTVMQAVDKKSEILVWRGCSQSGKPGHPVVFHRTVFPGIAQLRGDGGAKDVIAAAGSRTALIPLPGSHAVSDLDTPEDWAEWRGKHPDRA